MTAHTVTPPPDRGRASDGVLLARVAQRRRTDDQQARHQLLMDGGEFAAYAEALERRSADLHRRITETLR